MPFTAKLNAPSYEGILNSSEGWRDMVVWAWVSVQVQEKIKNRPIMTIPAKTLRLIDAFWRWRNKGSSDHPCG